MAYFLLNVKNVETGNPLIGMWLSRSQALVPFVDEYRYVVRYMLDEEATPQSMEMADPQAGIRFMSRYSRGLMGVWADALDAVWEQKKVNIRTANQEGVRPPKRITALINTREIFELNIGRQDDPGFVKGAVVIPGAPWDTGCFGVDMPHSPMPEILTVSSMLQCLMAQYPNLARPFFGEKSFSKAKCARCGQVIESRERHEFVSCSCGAIAVDGGTDYCRYVGKSEDFAVLDKDDKVKYVPNTIGNTGG